MFLNVYVYAFLSPCCTSVRLDSDIELVDFQGEDSFRSITLQKAENLVNQLEKKMRNWPSDGLFLLLSDLLYSIRNPRKSPGGYVQ